jgi:hypothetical protein
LNIELHGQNQNQPWKFSWLMVKPLITMVFRQLSKLTLGLESSPGNGIFIFYFFNIFCQAESQNHANGKKFGGKDVRYFFIAFFTPKNCDYKKSSQYFVEIFMPM